MANNIVCKACDTSLPVDSLFCPECGSNLKIQKMSSDTSITTVLVEDTIDTEYINKYDKLVIELQKLKGIDSEYQRQKEYVTELEVETQQAEKELQQIELTEEKELDDVEKLKGISWSSIVSRLKGDREEKIKKEEKEYLKIKNKREEREEEVNLLRDQLEEAQKQLDEIQQLVTKRDDLKEKIRILVNEACKGVADPVEDKIEENIKQLENKFAPIQHEMNQLQTARSHLKNAQSLLNRALDKLGSAKRMSTWDTFFGGGLIADSMKHSRWGDARSAVSKANMEIRRALQAYPNLPNISKANVEDRGRMGDVLFDNIFSDMGARQAIERSYNNTRRSFLDVSETLNWIFSQYNGMENEYNSINEQLEMKEKELYTERVRMIKEAMQK